MSILYYTPPPDNEFEEVKNMAMGLWQTIDTDNDEFGYASEKINRIKDLKNVGDNFMYMVAMFDIHNQKLLAEVLSDSTCMSIRQRMASGGMPKHLIVF